MGKKIICVLMCIFVLYGCYSNNKLTNDETGNLSKIENTIEDHNDLPDLAARSEFVLIEFHRLLNGEDYEQARNLYGGSYEMLEGYNPALDPSDKAGLLEAGCQFNGLMCLPVLSTKLVQVIEQHEFVYELTFKNPDGTTFVLGPCCGADEETMPPISTFTAHVVCETMDSCQVMDLPPYVP